LLPEPAQPGVRAVPQLNRLLADLGNVQFHAGLLSWRLVNDRFVNTHCALKNTRPGMLGGKMIRMRVIDFGRPPER
jgi:hypothetical protein